MVPELNSISGGAGVDTADYSGSSAGVNVAVSLGEALVASGGDAEGDTVAVENLIGSAFDDTLTGDAVAGSITNNVIDGGAGNDTLSAVAAATTR